MISWNYMLVAACLLLVFLFYNEWKRKSRSHLYIRLTASLVAVTSLLFTAYPYAKNNYSATEKIIIILTKGFIKDSVDQFLHQTGKDLPVFSDAAVRFNTSERDHVQLVADWHSFSEKHIDDTVYVFGNGLNKEALASLSPHPIVFRASPAAPCISHIYWKQNLQSGEPLTVQGHYENSSAQKVKILLQAFGANKDTVFIEAFSSRDFALQTIPALIGKAVYSLVSVAGNDTIEKEPVPVEVQPAKPLQLLIISSSPDFENTFLKNHLSQFSYQITVTATVSTNKISKQFINTPAQQAGKLTVPYLNKFDVLMADEEALQKISAVELAAIRSAIRDKGTGLVIKIDTQKNASAFYSKSFPIKNTGQDKQSFLLLHSAVADSGQYKIKSSDQLGIEYLPGMQIILQDAQSNIYAAGIAYGSGKIIATTLQNTYSIGLAGDKTSYQQLWTQLLNNAPKKIYPEESWQTNPSIPYIDNPVQLLTEDNNAGLPKAALPEANIYLVQDALLPFQWQGKYWPSTSGWQALPQLNMQTGSWYVYGTNDWKQIANHEHLTETKEYASAHPVLYSATPGQQAGIFFINWPLFMLVIFLCCCIFLWVEQKAG